MRTIQGRFPIYRPRRLRRSEQIRNLVRETTLHPADLIWPLFVCEDDESERDIGAMPGIRRYTVDESIQASTMASNLGINCIALFPYVAASNKTADCSHAWDEANLANRAARAIKFHVPQILVMLDVALDPYNSMGHDGIFSDGEIQNDITLKCLVKQALSHAKAGADILGPSDMMDGRIGAIRTALDNSNYQTTAILAYSAKFSSVFYGPFREAIGSEGALIGDKSTYQIDCANSEEALRMVQRDLLEGADMIMVKPGMPYLDICRKVKDSFKVPTFAYQVSGEYSMIELASRNNMFDRDKAIIESLIAFKRAGCDGILTYFAPDAARLIAN